MPIGDLCTNKFFTIDRTSTLQSAATLMKKHHTGGLIVVDVIPRGKPVGILTDRDIVLGAVAENLPMTTKVEEIMSKKIVKVSEHEGIAFVVHKMQEEGVRKMIVVDAAGNTCGMVSADDILQLVAQELSDLGTLMSRQVVREKSYRTASKIQ